MCDVGMYRGGTKYCVICKKPFCSLGEFDSICDACFKIQNEGG